ncbi:DUF1566 domain-containing protein [Hydrogenophaga sp. RWCD_12]|uniref:DUF1566 domain-containing protein n=1 Tax=Hydrogenophaga sp. RWCD_12 TaxID=3391190 RepID=UPI0039851072
MSASILDWGLPVSRQEKHISNDNRRFYRATLVCAFTLAIAACGGSDPVGTSGNNSAGRRAPLTRSETGSIALGGSAAIDVPTADAIAAQQEGARLNTQELARIAMTGVLPKAFLGKSLSGATKSAASPTPVYRFFNTRTSAHFFTTSETERANVQATLPFMTFEGPAFHSSSTAIPGLSPVHRFYNTRTGVHFYTITESERAHIVATLPQFSYEGVAYHASTLPGTGYTPLYRFFYAAKGFHFYTNSAAEKDHIIATLPQYSYEGIGYYVLGDDWQTPAVPHTGTTTSQCYAPGTDVLGDCDRQDILDFNGQQDGHRAGIHPMNYGGVFGFSNGFLFTYPATSCVYDRETGLTWEGKEAAGQRAETNTYLSTTVGNYVDLVNSFNLCGYNDWRLPNIEDLQGIVHYGKTTAPSIDTTWFPNSVGTYWGSSISMSSVVANLQLYLGNGYIDSDFHGTGMSAVRLVRGRTWTGQRYLVTTVPYGSDDAYNAVIDRKTGLVWRRCLEGQRWVGSKTMACVGAAEPVTHHFALARATGQDGWRLPNIKELAGFAGFKPTGPVLGVPPVVMFAPGESDWSATPFASDPRQAWEVTMSNGTLTHLERHFTRTVRLVRSDP